MIFRRSLVRELTMKSLPAYRRLVEAQAAIESAPPAQRAALIAGRAAEIGRASCRERVSIAV